MSLHAARGGAHEDLSWTALGRRAAPRDVIVGDRGGGVGMRRAQQQGGPAGAVRVDEASSASTFRQLDDAFLQKQTKIWLGEVLHLRFDEVVSVADLLADGELLFQVSKVLWKRLLKKNREQLKQSKVYIYERLSFGRSNGKYMPYSKVDSFLKICQILGLAGIDLFTPSDVVEKRNVRKVCICIRSVSKKSHIMRLNVPDFDIVTYTISMPNYIVGGICRSLEQPQYSSSGSSGHSPSESSKALQHQIIFDGENNEHGDTNYDSDEAESRPEDLVDEDNFAAVLSQLSNDPKEESEGYGESGHGMYEEKSLAESVGSLNFGVVDLESVDSTPQNHEKESYSTHCATDQCSRTKTAKCSLSSEVSDSISSHLAFESSKNDPELNAHAVEDSERIYDGHVKYLDHSIQGNGGTLADHPKKESADIQKDTGTMNLHCDALACDRESVCSSCEESRYGLNGEPPDSSSESHSGLNPTHTTDGKLPMVSDPVNNIEPSMSGMENNSTSEELNELRDTNEMVPPEMHKTSMSLDHSIQGNGGTLADHPKKERADIQKDTATMNLHFDTLACDKESVCSSCEESSYVLNGEPSDSGFESHSGLNPTHTTGCNLPMFSEDPMNNIEPSMSGMTNNSTNEELSPEFSDMNQMVPPETHKISLSPQLPMFSEDLVNDIEPSMSGMTNGSTSEEPSPEFSDTNQMEASQSVDKAVESEDIAKDSIAPQKPEADAPKSGKGVLKSVAGGITLVGAVFFMVHLRRSKDRSFTRVMPSLSEKSIQSDSRRAKNMDNEKVSNVYPGARLKV